MFSTSISTDLIEKEKLETLLETLRTSTGRTINLSVVNIIETDDVNVSLMLDALRGSLQGTKPPKSAREKREQKIAANGRKRSKVVKASWKPSDAKPIPTRGPHVRSIKVNGTGEMISRFELNKRLAEHTIEPNTELHSPKHGKIVVVQDDRGESYRLINEAGESI